MSEAQKLTKEDILLLRKKIIGPNLSISYQNPLLITSANKQYLIDNHNHYFLDCVNNVSHVGHSHPNITTAVTKQISILNTNTRYLHPIIIEYAQRLLALCPTPLEVVFFTNSGSEANDLALRLARSYTQSRDILCLESAYHGNVTSTVEISPYKYEGKGGFPKRKFVHKILAPDGYRGTFKKRDDPDYVSKYVDNVKTTIEDVTRSGRKIAAFIIESILGCAGQVVLPPNYLKSILPLLKTKGILYIADEVQTGFGRVGSHFWGFQTQGENVVPDILTIGKPMGNGFPLGGVVTTRAIADAFHNGMEYFNTFGGNPVSCTVGLTVLNIIRDEELQNNALVVGKYLLERLTQLQLKYSQEIGEVRGIGLFVGIELIKNTQTKNLEPDAQLATQIIEKMRHLKCRNAETNQEIAGVLLSTDGPDHNVIKIKPPIIFSVSDVNVLVSGLDTVFNSILSKSNPRSRL